MSEEQVLSGEAAAPTGPNPPVDEAPEPAADPVTPVGTDPSPIVLSSAPAAAGKGFWPGPAELGSTGLPLAVITGALGFAVFVPIGRTGVGWLAAGLVAMIAVLIAARGGSGTIRDTERVIRVAWGLASLALLSVLTFRNAWWLVTFCVLGALGCAALAIVGGRSIRSIVFSLIAAPFASLRGLPWVLRHLESRRGGPQNPGAGKRVLWSIVVTITFLLIFGALFASADAAFSELLAQFMPTIDAGVVFNWVFLLVVGALVMTAAVYLLAAPPDLSSMDTPSTRKLRLSEWVLPIAALVLLFGGFVSVQIAILFGGERHVLSTAGLSYAEYARSGFWQLLAVTVLTLLIVSGLARWASKESSVDRVMVRALLGLLSTLSVVIVASALSRMLAYQRAYSFTGERIFVMAFELLLGAVFVLIMLAGIRLRGAWVPRTVVGLAVIMLLSLAILNPERYAAERNVMRYDGTGKIDLWYLRALSADATPALAALPDELRECALSWIVGDLRQADPWYGWNLGRKQARQVLARLGPTAVGDCKEAGLYDYPKQR